MTSPCGNDRRSARATSIPRQRAARMEAAAGRRIGEIGWRTFEALPMSGIADARKAGNEVLGVGVHRRCKYSARRRLLDEAARVHNAEAVGERSVHAHVVGDK